MGSSVSAYKNNERKVHNMAGMPPWTEKRIDWYQRAVAWNGFDKVLVDNISRFVPQDESICDMGCGTGYLEEKQGKAGGKKVSRTV